jgi:hypothetical protein
VHVAIRDVATLRWHTPGGGTVGGDPTVGFPAELSDPDGTETMWSFDASALPPGNYAVFVMARDIHGNLALWYTLDGLRINIFVGTPEYDVPVLSADFGGAVSPGIDVSGTATDSSGVAAVRVAVRSQQTGLWHLPSGATRAAAASPPETLAVLGDPRAPSTTWSYNVGPLPSGNYNVLVRGADIYGNAIWWYTPGMLRIAVTVDGGPPVLTADYSANDVLPLPATLTGRAMDPTGVAAVRVAIRDKASLSWQLPDGSTASGDATIGFPAVLDEPLGVDTAWSFDAPALGPGFYEIFVMAVDADGNLALWHTADGLRDSVFVGTPEFDLPVVTAGFSEGDTIPSDGTLTGEATDESGVAAVRVAVRSQQTGLWHLPSGATRAAAASPPETLAVLADPRAPSTTWSYNVGALPSGNYNVLVRGADIYGNAIWWYLPGSLRIGVTVAPNVGDDLVAYYPFNGNANDESGNGNHGTVHGATLTEDGFGNPNSAYAFDGIDDHISIPYSSDFDFSQEKQISYGVWLDIESLDYLHNVPLGQDAPCSHFAYAIDIYGDTHTRAGHVEAAIHTSNCWLLTVSSGALTLNNWHQIFVTADEDSLRLYVNGEKVSETPLGDSIWNENTHLTNTYIGAWGGLNPLDQFLDGKIDDVRIYDRALSESEILELFNRKGPVNGVGTVPPFLGE